MTLLFLKIWNALLRVFRTSLIGGLIKVNKRILSQPNLSNILPLRLFEIADVVYKDPKAENNSRNEKHLCATICDVKSRFSDLHGLLDRVFIINKASNQLKLVRDICRVPLIASGGAGAKEHFLEAFRDANVDGALAASVFHKKMIAIAELKDWLSREGIEMRTLFEGESDVDGKRLGEIGF